MRGGPGRPAEDRDSDGADGAPGHGGGMRRAILWLLSGEARTMIGGILKPCRAVADLRSIVRFVK